MSAILPLAELQTRFCAWLAEPDAARGEALAARLGVGPGLAVYQNNYRVALVETLRETHARALAWLGDAAFDALAARHIDAVFSTHWTLDAYGESFPALLGEADPVDGEIALIDRAVATAFVAPDSPVASAAMLGAVDWDSARIVLVPSLALYDLTTNADTLWLALAGEDTPPAPDRAAPGTLMVWRQGFEPVMRRADPDERMMIAAIGEGLSFAEICAQLAEDGDAADAVTRAGTVLGRWLGEALVAGFA